MSVQREYANGIMEHCNLQSFERDLTEKTLSLVNTNTRKSKVCTNV